MRDFRRSGYSRGMYDVWVGEESKTCCFNLGGSLLGMSFVFKNSVQIVMISFLDVDGHSVYVQPPCLRQRRAAIIISKEFEGSVIGGVFIVLGGDVHLMFIGIGIICVLPASMQWLMGRGGRTGNLLKNYSHF